jgi:hypothetical protein
VVEPERQQPVVQVVAVRREGRAPGVQPYRHDGQRVDDRQAEQQQRQGRAVGHPGTLRELDRQDAHREAEQLAAAVAHEHPRRVGVEAQEAEQAAHEGEGHRRDDGRPRPKLRAAIAAQHRNVVPPARPSSPSARLIAFVTPSRKRKVSGSETPGAVRCGTSA